MDEEPLPRREQLQALLEARLGSEEVHFQAPNNTELQYPCILYKWDDARTQYADNKQYRFTKRYQVTVIDRDPDSEIPGKIAQLPLCSFDRFFTAENLNHFVFNLFF